MKNMVMIVTFFGLVIVFVVLWLLIKQRKKNKKGKLAVDLGSVFDVHSHILPGVDDGAKNMDMTIKMLDMAYRQGVRRMIATPHYDIGHSSAEAIQVQEVFEKVQREAAKKYPDLQLKLGSEIFFSEGIVERLNEKKAFTMAESPYVLVEFRVDQTFSYLKGVVIKLQRMGYRPIIAHAERYQCLKGKCSRIKELKELGAKIQVNYNSIPKQKKLFREGLVDFLGTDCHDDVQRPPRITENIRELQKVCTREQIKEILEENPKIIWNYESKK